MCVGTFVGAVGAGFAGGLGGVGAGMAPEPAGGLTGGAAGVNGLFCGDEVVVVRPAFKFRTEPRFRTPLGLVGITFCGVVGPVACGAITGESEMKFSPLACVSTAACVVVVSEGLPAAAIIDVGTGVCV